MKKYINASELLDLFRDDEMLSCDRPFDVYQWAENIVDECPPAKDIIRLPFSVGTWLTTADGRRGVIEAFYIGKNGIQRVFARLSDGEKINFTLKGVGKDVFIDDAPGRKISRSDGVSAFLCDSPKKDP